MADPLQKDDFRFSSIDEELDEKRGKVMAYHVPLQDPIRRRATVSRTNMGLDLPRPDWQLPEGGNRHLNRAAEQVGGAIGRAVSQARRVPDSARERLQLVRDRAKQAKDTVADRISSSASSLADGAEQRALTLAATAQERARDWMDRAEERGRVALDEVDQLSRKATERATRLKEEIEERSREWRMKARLRAEQMRGQGERMIHQHPLEVLGCIAGVAFLAGVSLRIVRARNACRY